MPAQVASPCFRGPRDIHIASPPRVLRRASLAGGVLPNPFPAVDLLEACGPSSAPSGLLSAWQCEVEVDSRAGAPTGLLVLKQVEESALEQHRRPTLCKLKDAAMLKWCARPLEQCNAIHVVSDCVQRQGEEPGSHVFRLSIPSAGAPKPRAPLPPYPPVQHGAAFQTFPGTCERRYQLELDSVPFDTVARRQAQATAS